MWAFHHFILCHGVAMVFEIIFIRCFRDYLLMPFFLHQNIFYQQIASYEAHQ